MTDKVRPVSITIVPADLRNGIRYEIENGVRVYRRNHLANSYTRDFRGFKDPKKARDSQLVGYGLPSPDDFSSKSFEEFRVPFVTGSQDEDLDDDELMMGEGITSALEDFAKFDKIKGTLKRQFTKLKKSDLNPEELEMELRKILVKHSDLLTQLGIVIGIPALVLSITSLLGHPEAAPIITKILKEIATEVYKGQKKKKEGGAIDIKEPEPDPKPKPPPKPRAKKIKAEVKAEVKTEVKTEAPKKQRKSRSKKKGETAVTIDIIDLVKTKPVEDTTVNPKAKPGAKRPLSDKMKRRNILVKKIMKDKGLTMILASKYIRDNDIKY